MAKVTAQEFAEKWNRRLKAAVPDIQRGIDRVTKSPTELAAAKQEKMLANLTEAVQSGKWAARLRAVSLEEWKAKARDVGTQRIASGADAALSKQVEFAEQLLPYIDSLKAEIDRMPDLTLEDSINRATAWIRGMSRFQKK